MPSPSKPRVLILVVAYYAERTLVGVLSRIPDQVLRDNDCEILVVDDASEDRTFSIGREYGQAHPELPLTVVRNAINQGYGGNQKVGYVYAIEQGFDCVVMLHGDGQYAPEELPRMIAPILHGRADAVFGSRMMTPFGALRGGMPLYKYVGNRILSTAQNALLRTRLSEFHSGYRAYRVAALARTSFRLNSNDFHFDTEIIVQLVHGGHRIEEIPIPTYYGDEICRVNGMRYAKDVMAATIKSALHRAGLLHQPRYEPADGGQPDYSLKLGYRSSHQAALDVVPPAAKVLDLGGGSGDFARELVKRGCEVTVVDKTPAPASEYTTVAQQLDRPFRFSIDGYSHVVMLDVIEHLLSPEGFLERLREQFTDEDKTLVFTTPNIAFVVPRLMLLAGMFNYGKQGILDRTHTRLFTFRSFKTLLDDAGLRIERLEGIPAPFPKAIGDNRLSRALLKFNEGLIRLSPGLFSYQILVVAKSKPTVEFVLRSAIASRHAEAGGDPSLRAANRNS